MPWYHRFSILVDRPTPMGWYHHLQSHPRHHWTRTNLQIPIPGSLHLLGLFRLLWPGCVRRTSPLLDSRSHQKPSGNNFCSYHAGKTARPNKRRMSSNEYILLIATVLDMNEQDRLTWALSSHAEGKSSELVHVCNSPGSVDMCHLYTEQSTVGTGVGALEDKECKRKII